MLNLLKETATGDNSSNAIEKRKLLFPLMASLATQKNNKLFCYHLYYDWLKAYPCKENEVNYPHDALQNWCIDQKKLDKIIKLARDIIESKTNYILTQAETKSALYANELLAIQSSVRSLPPDIDRWLALVVGNILHNDLEVERFFNWDIVNYSRLFDLIRNWNYSFQESAPSWGKKYFAGINKSTDSAYYYFEFMNLRGINFSHSDLQNISFRGSDISDCDFTDMRRFANVDLSGALQFGKFFPPLLAAKYNQHIGFPSENWSIDSTYIYNTLSDHEAYSTLRMISSQKLVLYDYTASPFTHRFPAFALAQYGIKTKRFTRAEATGLFVERHDSNPTK